ncbi:MAG: UDP-N-acetylmuramate dehydrogenase [bacterium]
MNGLFDQTLNKIFSEVKSDEPMSLHTTAKVGGKARRFVDAHQTEQIPHAVTCCRRFQVPFFVLGNGSNVIFSDKGFDGLVIRNLSQNYRILASSKVSQSKSDIPVRYQPLPSSDTLPKSDKQERIKLNTVLVEVDSGLRLTALMKNLLKQGITGLEWFAGIPASVGGAIYMNLHGGERFFSHLVAEATLLSGEQVKVVPNAYFKFNYDYSVLHDTREIVLRAILRLQKSDVSEAERFSRQWAKHKSMQPQKSAGCIFRNLTEEEQIRLNLPTSSTGYVIDKILQLKGTRCGDAVISTQHAAFIENLGKAKAADFYTLTQLIKNQAKQKLNLDLKLEVEFVGEFQN